MREHDVCVDLEEFGLRTPELRAQWFKRGASECAVAQHRCRGEHSGPEWHPGRRLDPCHLQCALAHTTLLGYIRQQAPDQVPRSNKYVVRLDSASVCLDAPALDGVDGRRKAHLTALVRQECPTPWPRPPLPRGRAQRCRPQRPQCVGHMVLRMMLISKSLLRSHDQFGGPQRPKLAFFGNVRPRFMRPGELHSELTRIGVSSPLSRIGEESVTR